MRPSFVSLPPLPRHAKRLKRTPLVSRAPPPRRPWREDDPLLTRLNAFTDSSQKPVPQDSSILESSVQKFLAAPKVLDDFLSKPVRLFSLSAASILFGFFSATSASTIIGSVADWDPLAAAVLLVWTESFTKYYYTVPSRGRFLQLANAFKIGLIYGMTLDAFKLST